MTTTLPRALAAIAFFAAAPQAQQEWGDTKVATWPGVFGAGGFDECTPGRFTDDDRESVIVRRGRDLYLVHNPAVYNSISAVEISGIATGIATLPRAGGDRLLVARTDGPAIGELVGGSFVFAPAMDSRWNGATQIAVRYQSGTRAHCFAAISADGLSVLTGVALFDAEPIALAKIAINEQVLRVEVLDWDGDGSLDVVAVTAGEIRPFNLNGGPKPLAMLVGNNPATAVLASPTRGDRLAYVTEVAGVNLLFVRNANDADLPLLLDGSGLQLQGPFSVRGLVASDMDGDGDTDLVVSQSGSHGVLHLTNSDETGTGQAFSALTPQLVVHPVWNVVGDPATNKCVPVWIDLDDSGRPDLFLPLDTTGTVVTAFDVDGISTAQIQTTWLDDSVVYLDGRIGLKVPAGAVVGFDYMQIVTWHQDDPFPLAVAAPALDLTAVANYEWDLSTLAPDNSGNLCVWIALQPTGTSGPFWPDHYYFEMRLRKTGAKDYSKTRVGGLSMKLDDSDGNYLDYLYSLEGEEPKKSDVKDYRSTIVGGILTSKIIPPFPTSGPPSPGPVVPQ